MRLAPSGGTLTPIDHGLCLPGTFSDISFEWRYWYSILALPGCHDLRFWCRSRRCVEVVKHMQGYAS